MWRMLKIVIAHILSPLDIYFDSVDTIQMLYNNNTIKLYENIVDDACT